MKRIIFLISIILLFISCGETGNGKMGVYNAYGKWEIEGYDPVASYHSAPSVPSNLNDIGYTQYVREHGHPKYMNDKHWETGVKRINWTISYLEAKAEEKGVSRDWYVDNWLSENESNTTD
jgi:hypothetical protein